MFVGLAGYGQAVNPDSIFGYRHHRTFHQVIVTNLQHTNNKISQSLPSKAFNANANYRGSSQSGECEERVEIGIECDNDRALLLAKVENL